MATPPSPAPPLAGARDSGGRHDADRAPRGGSPVARFLQRASGAAALVPMMLLSAAAADTLHPPAAVGAFGRLDGVRDARAAAMFATMRDDTSGMRIGADDERLLEMCEVFVDALGAEEVDNPTGGAKSAWKAWLGFCSWAGVLPWRTDAAAALGSSEAARQREALIWVNALMYIYPRMKPQAGRTEHPKPASALAILQHVRRLHVKLDIPVISLKPCVRAMHKLVEHWVEEYGIEALQPRRKAALTAELIIELMRITATDPSLAAGDGAMWATMWQLLAQTGMRKAEVALADGGTFGKFNISWDNVKWRVGGIVYPALTPALRNLMTDGDMLIVRPPPSKADPFALKWGISPMYLPYSESAPICAARAMADYEIARGPAAGRRAKTPLFAVASGAPLRRGNVSKHFDAWMAQVGAARGWASGESKKYTACTRSACTSRARSRRRARRTLAFSRCCAGRASTPSTATSRRWWKRTARGWRRRRRPSCASTARITSRATRATGTRLPCRSPRCRRSSARESGRSRCGTRPTILSALHAPAASTP